MNDERVAQLGPEVLTFVSDLFESDGVLLQLREVQAIVTFLRAYPPERREAACLRARFYGVSSVRTFKDILRKELDFEALPGGLIAGRGTVRQPRFARAAASPATPTPEA